MDFNILLTIIMGLSYTVVPALMMAMLTGYSNISFMAFVSIFSAISIYFGYLPTWFTGITVLIIAAVLYDTLANRGRSE